MQCDIYHPFQCLADLDDPRKRRAATCAEAHVVSWAYAASYLIAISVPQSLILQMPRFGMDVTLSYPPNLADADMWPRRRRRRASTAPPSTSSTTWPRARGRRRGVRQVVGAAAHHRRDPAEGKRIQDQYKDWITDAAKMGRAKPDAIYMHPLPADRTSK
jgi:N-acetylornithine carbamoyltransferase